MNEVVKYHRKNQLGTLTFHGVADIFEAENIHKCALKAYKDNKTVDNIHVDFTSSERVDISVWQILLSLNKSLQQNGRRLVLLPETSSVYTKAESAGIIALFSSTP